METNGKKTTRAAKKRWLDVGEEDINRMRAYGWRELAQDRDKWRDLVMAVKSLREYYGPDEEEEGCCIYFNRHLNCG